ASKLALLNLVLIILTIPFYLFVVVYVPSYPKMFYPEAQSLIRGMEPLLYNLDPNINEFFMGYETFNNCFPSMHIGFPSAILMTLVWNIQGYRGYKIFLFVMIILITLSIVYLGIHWLSDIAGGLLIALLGVFITEKVSRRFWGKVHKFRRKHQRCLSNK
ncbi:MAG: phosphatase PAP2 family protein, partial [Thermoplasmata archaeon]|nr:phosphatase PAP2 family protein [Thermoplasmata archaeon]